MTGEATRTNQIQVGEAAGLRDTISGLFDDFFIGKPVLTARHLQMDSGIGWCPAVDIRESEEELVAYADLPGVEREDIQLEVKDHTLVLTGKRRMAAPPEEGWLRRETPAGAFYRAFRFSPDVKANQVTASFKSGVLEIHLPKAEEAKPHKVKIG